jgi:peptide/nickel transport system permease protein
MRAYIIRRLLTLVPTLLLLTVIIFFVVHIIPGDAVDAMQLGNTQTRLDRATLEHELGLDAPLYLQYARWMGIAPQMDGRYHGIFQGDFGDSWSRRAPIVKLIGFAWPITLELALLGLLVAQLIALPIGILSAVRQDTLADYVGRSIAILSISVPGFWLGTMIIVFPAIWWGYMPSIMWIPFLRDPLGNLKMFIVPAAVLGMTLGGGTMRLIRTMMLEVLRQDYIRTAWAKGLKEGVVVSRHALKNALIPVVTLVGLQLPFLFGGTVIVEQIFSLSGMGRLIIGAFQQRDELLISGVVLFFAVALSLINLLIDLTYAWLDPKIHYR